MNKRTLMKKSGNRNKSRSVSTVIGSMALVMGLFLVPALAAAAAEKTEYDDVIINDYKLGFFEQIALEDHIDRDIPDGNYWFELDTGMWGPVGGTSMGRIVVPEDYRDYVITRLFKPSKAAKVEVSASIALAVAKDNQKYLKPGLYKPRTATKVELASGKDYRDSVKPRIFNPAQTTKKVKLFTTTEECDRGCLTKFITRMVAAFSPKI